MKCFKCGKNCFTCINDPDKIYPICSKCDPASKVKREAPTILIPESMRAVSNSRCVDNHTLKEIKRGDIKDYEKRYDAVYISHQEQQQEIKRVRQNKKKDLDKRASKALTRAFKEKGILS